MPNSKLPTTKPALERFHQLVDDISRLYVDVCSAQVRFAWEAGRRIVQEEQNGAMRAAYGSGLIEKLSNGPGSAQAPRGLKAPQLLDEGHARRMAE